MATGQEPNPGDDWEAIFVLPTIVGPISCTGAPSAQMSADSVFFVSEDGEDG
jgi:hypothetical protein